MDIIKRFKEKFNQKDGDSCWEWAGSKERGGYGHFWFDGRPAYAHRVSYEIFKGPIPDGMLVLHKCNNRGCVNPSHLYLGDQSDNHGDMLKAGNQVMAFPTRRNLTAGQVFSMREEYASGWFTYAELARRHNVNKETVKQVVLRKTYKDIE